MYSSRYCHEDLDDDGRLPPLVRKKASGDEPTTKLEAESLTMMQEKCEKIPATFDSAIPPIRIMNDDAINKLHLQRSARNDPADADEKKMPAIVESSAPPARPVRSAKDIAKDRTLRLSRNYYTISREVASSRSQDLNEANTASGAARVGAVAIPGIGVSAVHRSIDEGDATMANDEEMSDSPSQENLPNAEAIAAELASVDVEARVQERYQRLLRGTPVAQVEKPGPSRKKRNILIGTLAILVIGGVVGAVVAVFTGTDDSTNATSDPNREYCTLCYGGSNPADLVTNTVFSGQTCGEFQEAVEVLELSNPSCRQAQAIGWDECGCPEIPPTPENPTCSICGDGSPPTSEQCADLDTFVALVDDFRGSCADVVAYAVQRGPCICPDDLESFRNVLVPISGDSLDVPGSPQNQALQWIVGRDPAKLEVGSVPDEVIQLRFVAAVIYYSLNGEAWTSKLNFLTEGNICSWNQNNKGIICPWNGEEVTRLMLSSNLLGGTIPTELGIFTTMTELDLAENVNIAGTIPTEIGLLTDLTEGLLLDVNRLEGSIPSELGRLASVVSIWLRENQLTGTLPMELASCGSLMTLDASFNMLTGSISSLLDNISRDIRNLDVSDNTLSGILPTSIGELSKLEWADFAVNNFMGTLPTEVGHLVASTLLSVERNKLAGNIPSELGLCTPLRILGLGNNLFTGTVPTQIAQLTRLERLFLASNNLSGDVNAICDASIPFQAFAANTCGEADDLDCYCCSHCCYADTDVCDSL